MKVDMAGPLDGIKIIDLCRDLAGAYACMLLGDMGAEVTKVEPVDGDPMRSEPAFQLWNRGRRSVAVDIQTREGREVLEGLVARCDVLVETFLASEALELGVDYERLGLLNPGLIYCALPPFGDSGPLAHLPADDGVVSAYAGLYGDQGGQDQPPVFVHLPIVSYGTAFLAAFATSSALYTREMSGHGQKVEVPWYGGIVAMKSGSIVSGPNVTHWTRGASSPRGANPLYRLYKCEDEWLLIACGNATFWNKLCIALGLEHLVEDPRFADAPWNIPLEHREPLSSIIGDVLAERPRAYWLEHLLDHDVPCAPVESRETFGHHPQVEHSGILVEADDPILGATRQMGVPVRLWETPGSAGSPAPAAGEHTGEILAWLGYSAEKMESLAEQGIIRLGDGEQS